MRPGRAVGGRGLVDDHIGMARAVATMVRLSQHDVAAAHSGRAALDHIATHQIDLIILHMSMPGMSALDVLQELGGSGRLADLPVLMYSASPEHRDELLRLGRSASSSSTRQTNCQR
jgi:CheY-like chemotaxis protein